MKSFIVKKIIKISIMLAILVTLYVVGCNAVNGETVTSEPEITPIAPLPNYTAQPTSEPVITDEPIDTPPIFYMPPHNSSISIRWYASWLTANGTPLYLYPDGHTGSVPPNYTAQPYTSGDICDVQFAPAYDDFSMTYDSVFEIDFFVNMNATPIHDFQNYTDYRFWVNIDSWEVRDEVDPSLRVDYTATFSVKLSGYNEEGVYTSAYFSQVYDRKEFKNGVLEIECNAASYFTELNRADCSIVFEAELPNVYSSVNDSAWNIYARGMAICDRLQTDKIGTVLQSMFLPSNMDLQAFINSKMETVSPGSGWRSAFDIIQDIITSLADPHVITGSTVITLPALSVSLDSQDTTRNYQYFNGGWFDLEDWSFDFGGMSYAGTDKASTVYQWIKTVSSVLITCDFILLVFNFVLAFINSTRFANFVTVEPDESDEKPKKRRR